MHLQTKILYTKRRYNFVVAGPIYFDDVVCGRKLHRLQECYCGWSNKNKWESATRIHEHGSVVHFIFVLFFIIILYRHNNIVSSFSSITHTLYSIVKQR